MAKFKVGDVVGYMYEGKPMGPFTVSGLESEDRVRFSIGSWMYDYELHHWPDTGKNRAVSGGGSWDYAEARRLQDAANAAVEAYNEYIKRKPTDVFPEVWNPFQS